MFHAILKMVERGFLHAAILILYQDWKAHGGSALPVSDLDKFIQPSATDRECLLSGLGSDNLLYSHRATTIVDDRDLASARRLSVIPIPFVDPVVEPPESLPKARIWYPSSPLEISKRIA